jgi:hypothetical protein
VESEGWEMKQCWIKYKTLCLKYQKMVSTVVL